MKSIIAIAVLLGTVGGVAVATVPPQNPRRDPTAFAANRAAAAQPAAVPLQGGNQPPSMRILINGIDTGHSTTEFQWNATVGESGRRWVIANPQYTTLETYAELMVNAQYRR